MMSEDHRHPSGVSTPVVWVVRVCCGGGGDAEVESCAVGSPCSGVVSGSADPLVACAASVCMSWGFLMCCIQLQCPSDVSSPSSMVLALWAVSYSLHSLPESPDLASPMMVLSCLLLECHIHTGSLGQRRVRSEVCYMYP